MGNCNFRAEADKESRQGKFVFSEWTEKLQIAVFYPIKSIWNN